MVTREQENVCGYCANWWCHTPYGPHEDDGAPFGSCHRYAPRPVTIDKSDIMGMGPAYEVEWPETTHGSWCAEYADADSGELESRNVTKKAVAPSGYSREQCDKAFSVCRSALTQLVYILDVRNTVCTGCTSGPGDVWECRDTTCPIKQSMLAAKSARRFMDTAQGRRTT